MKKNNNNIQGMRDNLYKDIEDLRAGKLSVPVSHAISTAIGKHIALIKLELTYNKLTGKKPKISYLDK